MADKVVTESVLRKVLGEFSEAIGKRIDQSIENLDIKVASEFAVVHSEINDLKSDVSTLKQDVSDLKEDMGEVKSDVSYLKKRMDYLVEETTLNHEDHEKRISSLEHHAGIAI